MKEPLWEIGAIVSIGGLDGVLFVKTNLVYDYEALKKTSLSDCPVCHGCGMPWNGWFSCEDCGAIAWIATGEVFARLGLPKEGVKRVKATMDAVA